MLKFTLPLIFLLVGCQEPTKTVQTVPGKTIEETNALVMGVLEKSAPQVVSMEKGLGQAIELMNVVNNSTRIYSDQRIIGMTPDVLVETFFNDPQFGVICGGFALVMFDSLTALGYENRMVQLFSNGPDTHIVNEVKIDGEWYGLDATFNIYFKGENGESLSYKLIKEAYVSNGFFAPEYAGETILKLSDYYMPYEPYLYAIRALPVGYRGMPNLNVVLDGEERY